LQKRELQIGLARIKAIGAEVALIDPQFVPVVINAPNAAAMVSDIRAIAETKQVGLFQRFALMRHWHEVEHVPFETFVTADRLHMNDWGYDCFARSLAVAIDNLAAPRAPTLVASPAAAR
jgi:hypothetical protein